MRLDTQHLLQCLKTLESALQYLDKADPESIDYEVFRNAVIKGFELSLEISGKLLRKALKNYSADSREVDAMVFKDIFRNAAKHGLIEQESVKGWFAYRDNRNNTAHDYGIAFAKQTLKLLPSFLKDAYSLEKNIREKFGNKNA